MQGPFYATWITYNPFSPYFQAFNLNMNIHAFLIRKTRPKINEAFAT